MSASPLEQKFTLDLFMRPLFLRLVALTIFILFARQALADDWNVVRLRGEVLQQVDGSWQPLSKGDSVSDTRTVATKGSGHLTLSRGGETIELGPNTQIQIHDQGSKKKPFTTVVQTIGTVAIEAEVQNVQHFAVKNQYLAAVVKGTRFTVTTSRSGSTVNVDRGHVEVDSSVDHSTTLLSVGQKAKVQKGKPMAVSGRGKLPTVLKAGAKKSNAPADKVAVATSKVEQAIADLEQAQASGDAQAIETAKDALEDAADNAADLAEDIAKSDDKAAAKAAADAAKAAEKAARDAEKAADEARKAANNADMGDKGDKPGKGPGDEPAPPPKNDKPSPPPPPPKDDKPGKEHGHDDSPGPEGDKPKPPAPPTDHLGSGPSDEPPMPPKDDKPGKDDKPEKGDKPDKGETPDKGPGPKGNPKSD